MEMYTLYIGKYVNMYKYKYPLFQEFTFSVGTLKYLIMHSYNFQ